MSWVLCFTDWDGDWDGTGGWVWTFTSTWLPSGVFSFLSLSASSTSSRRHDGQKGYSCNRASNAVVILPSVIRSRPPRFSLSSLLLEPGATGAVWISISLHRYLLISVDKHPAHIFFFFGGEGPYTVSCTYPGGFRRAGVFVILVRGWVGMHRWTGGPGWRGSLYLF